MFQIESEMLVNLCSQNAAEINPVEKVAFWSYDPCPGRKRSWHFR